MDGMWMGETPVISLLVASLRITSGEGESCYCGATDDNVIVDEERRYSFDFISSERISNGD